MPLGEPNLTPSATEVKEPPSADLLAHGRAVMELLERTARTATSPGTDSATSDTSNTTGIITGLTEDSATGMAIKATDWKSLPGSAPDTPLSNSPGAAFHAMDVAAEPAAASAELPLPMAMPKAATAAAVDESDPLAANPMDSNAPGVVGTAADPDLCPELGTCDNGNGAESVAFIEDIINAPPAANATAHSTVVSDLGAVGPAALAHDTIPKTGVAPVTTPVVPPTGAGDVGEPPLAAGV